MTPLLVYLYATQRKSLQWSAFGVWLVVLFTTDALSLVLDWISLLRWLGA